MVDKAFIPEAEASDKHIRLEDYNEIVRVVNKLEKSSANPTSMDYATEDGVIQNTLTKNTRIIDFPFRLQDHSGKVLSIIKGNWIRNQTSVLLEAYGDVTDDPDDNTKLLIDVTSFKNDEASDPLEVDTDYYVYVKLLDNISETNQLYDLALIPGKLNLYVDRDRATAHARTPAETDEFIDENPTTRSFWIKDREVIGTVQLYKVNDVFFIKEIKQRINEDIIDSQNVLDSMNKTTVDLRPDWDTIYAGHARYTLENNPVVDNTWEDGVIHFGETQLFDVNNCPGNNSASIAFFHSLSTHNYVEGPAGVLRWASPDGNYLPQGTDWPDDVDFRTLEIHKDLNKFNKPNKLENWSSVNSFKVLDLYRSSNTAPHSKSICFYDSGSNDGYGQVFGVLDWAVIDSQRDGSTQKTLEVREVQGGISSPDDPHTFQLHKVSNTAPSSLSICFYDAGARFESNTPGQLKWAVIDSEEYESDQKSLELREEVGTYDDPNVIQLYDFDSPAASIQPDTADRILVRKASNKTLIYVDIPDVLTQANVESTAITVVTDVRYASPYLQKKTRTIYILESESESSWQTYATAEECAEEGGP